MPSRRPRSSSNEPSVALALVQRTTGSDDESQIHKTEQRQRERWDCAPAGSRTAASETNRGILERSASKYHQPRVDPDLRKCHGAMHAASANDGTESTSAIRR